MNIQPTCAKVRLGWKADISGLRRAVTRAKSCDMTSIAENWWNEDGRDLFRSLEVIASDAPNPDRVGLCLETILNDLEPSARQRCIALR